jgi:hypothetical protein
MTLTIAVDDEDPKFQGLFDEHGKISPFFNWGKLKDAAMQATKDKYDNEWELDNENIEVESLNTQSAQEALKYKTFDAMTGKWLN